MPGLWSAVLNMLFDGTECFGGNVTDKELANDAVGHKRSNKWPTEGEIVHNADMHQRPVCVQKPCDLHASADATHVCEVNLVLD